jgi:hypothetical protein
MKKKKEIERQLAAHKLLAEKLGPNLVRDGWISALTWMLS